MCTSGLVVRDELDRSRRGRRSTLSSGLEVTLLGRTTFNGSSRDECDDE
eukprot:CAMPEP_0198715104 /NCGR_PEP_ID=MMETSP1471-20131121/27425_1 /TAXON_ID=41880 /ORGANISM="Pycnococcus provasolii, Strain RCC733" /LENGTH=48 /DNA_ID= /DNA_START= /DNA_END= /DNA_ORIENTATION=